ncbi:hypothetical protein [Actinomadura sp. 9N407]|uniref:hypothetical protein n=1 Tax=Actinomadura sp. 9N407 TaxID=3375154 RepID=UPI0037BABEAE
MASFAGSAGGGFDPAAGRSGIWAPGGEVRARVGAELGAVVRAAFHRTVDEEDVLEPFADLEDRCR